MPDVGQTLSQIAERHFLANDLAPETENWYRRVVNVFTTWHGTDAAVELLTPELLSVFLKAKQSDGLSAYYRRSLRNGLIALLGTRINGRLVRTIKLGELEPMTWTKDEVERLVGSVAVLPEYKRDYYAKLVMAAYYSGLSQVDLHRLTRRDILSDGSIPFARKKTGAAVVTWIPVELLRGLPLTGAIFPRRWSNEQFRRDFARIVKAAGLTGTFKTLRKTSGTEAELATGRGHEHLGNTRAVFEKHYLDKKRVHREPVRLPRLKPGKSA